jgi:hypothetical protein
MPCDATPERETLIRSPETLHNTLHNTLKNSAYNQNALHNTVSNHNP